MAALDQQQNFEDGQANRVLVADAIVEFFRCERLRTTQAGDVGQCQLGPQVHPANKFGLRGGQTLARRVEIGLRRARQRRLRVELRLQLFDRRQVLRQRLVGALRVTSRGVGVGERLVELHLGR